MAEKLLMMALSPTMTEGTITKWRVAEGAAFKAGELLCEVETDKASMDYEAPKDAVLLKILLSEGGKAAVGESIAVIGSAGEDPGPAIAMAIPEARKGPTMPTAPVALAGGAAEAPAAPVAEGSSAAVGPSAPSSYPPSSPLARSLARELGLDLRGARGSGPGGRVVERDVRGLASRGSSTPQTEAPHTAAPASLQSGPSPERRVPVSGKRAVIARRLSESFFTAPHFYLKRRADSGPLMALREATKAGRERSISLNAFLVKLAAEAIARHPYVNSSWEGDSIVERSSIDIGLAVALPDGLITPLVRDCARKSITAIDEELSLLIAKAKDKGLQPAEYEGAGFTISNLGSYGVEEFTAIINPPGSAILAVGAAVKEPFVREDGSVGVRRAMALTLGCDHRVIDGAAGARFLSTLVSFIEDPGKALV
jgi:pyruvate dehydrogenase E2 component (dihydrolipoamide acetyltransferase)